MALFEILNTSFFISLAILLLVSSILIFYMNLRISQQDHKISSMLGLIATMAEEVNFVRSKLQSPVNNHHSGGYGSIPNNSYPSLIEVSDDDDDDEEDDDDTEDDDTDEEDDDEEEEEDKEENIKKLNINLGQNINEIIDISSQINNFTNEDQSQNHDLESVDDDDFDDETIESTQTKCIKITNQNDSDNKSLFNNLNIPGIMDENVNSFKNMSVQKLRSIVVEKGILSNNDASKLKKNDILKMLNC
jgi:hypothetical protein